MAGSIWRSPSRRRAIDAGVPLMVHGYPVTALPSGGSAERALLLAIVRQESAFAPDAMKPAQARGLMQLMPATAANIARKIDVQYSLDRLTSDGIYNLVLGRLDLEKLLDDFGGSYVLAIAAYNAGPGRVRQWLSDFGDPRGTDIVHGSGPDRDDPVQRNPPLCPASAGNPAKIYRGQAAKAQPRVPPASDLAR